MSVCVYVHHCCGFMHTSCCFCLQEQLQWITALSYVLRTSTTMTADACLALPTAPPLKVSVLSLGCIIASQCAYIHTFDVLEQTYSKKCLAMLTRACLTGSMSVWNCSCPANYWVTPEGCKGCPADSTSPEGNMSASVYAYSP